MERLIQEMLQASIIRDSCNPFVSSIVMVKRKDGNWHLCVHYKQLNQHTMKYRLLIPIIQELHDELGHAFYFPKLDLHSYYH